MKAAALVGEVESPRPLRAPDGRATVTGWCFRRGSPELPPLRVAIGRHTWLITARHPRDDVGDLFPAEPAARISGFSQAIEWPSGVHLVRFEAEIAAGHWETFKLLSLAADAAPFTAVLDEPISAGTLRDRVKVGGWALDRLQTVEKLTLRYGHREIDCQLGLPRRDVPAAFPAVPHAANAGFRSADFLVAGHGPVRVRAQLADGSLHVARTNVTFSIATDENHTADLDLTVPRTGLPGHAALTPRRLPTPAAHALNVLFVLPGSFAANNALHAAGLANELSARGHRCAIAVTHDVATIAHHAAPRFAALSHAEAPSYRFADARGADIVHAWTTRESVRRATEEIRRTHACRVVIHLEDNEREILALSLGQNFDQLNALSDVELDALVPAELSHPHRSRDFLASADGVTLITPRLREFTPVAARCHTLWPAADDRYFFPRALPEEFRRALGIPSHTTVIFYHGNVHAANAAEVRELYAAVTRLNEDGVPVTLIRTGLDTVDFLGAHASRAHEHVLELGQILHHRHLPPLMALADIFVQPGGRDAFNDYRFPSKLPEFFSIGRPVVLPRTNLGEKIRHGVDAYVLEQADAAGIARAVRELRAQPALAARLAEGAVRFAAANFSWARSAEALAKFYQSLPASAA
ncbi:MAG: hypothetical protein C0518_00445 [Opitutus sp.]|nr:hypothetical protein [Opitutus sp.]